MAASHPLRHFRIEVLGISQAALADRVSLSKASISRMEKGVQPITLGLLRDIAAMAARQSDRDRLLRDLMRNAMAAE